jgi:hypothetical protein
MMFLVVTIKRTAEEKDMRFRRFHSSSVLLHGDIHRNVLTVDIVVFPATALRYTDRPPLLVAQKREHTVLVEERFREDLEEPFGQGDVTILVSGVRIFIRVSDPGFSKYERIDNPEAIRLLTCLGAC